MTNQSFLHKVFCDISLEKDPDLWQNDEDTEEKNIERIRFISEFSETLYKVQLDKDRSSNRKNSDLCRAMKEKGNKSYGSGDNLTSLTQYNQALMYSSKKEDTALILANRSALWFDLGEHDLVEKDIDLAMRLGYPDNLVFKLHERRAKSRFAMEKIEEAKEDIKLAQKYLELSKLDELKKKKKFNEFDVVLNKLKNSKERNSSKLLKDGNPSPEHILPKLASNKKFPAFSDAVKIKFEAGRGRFAVSARDIEVGELIAVENAFVALIDKEFSKTHCWHCLICCKRPIPCDRCSGVIFCSDDCKEISTSSYHKYECMFTDILYQANLGAWRLAFRALTSYPWSYFQENLDVFLGRNELQGLEGEAVYSSQDILNFHSLVTHDGSANKKAPELMMQAHVVVFLIRVLRVAEYFGSGESAELKLSEDEINAARILHHFMRAAFYNTHEITQVEKTGPGFDENHVQRIGRVTNPTLALINHSCDPNYRRVSTSTRTFGFACKPIRKGEEISDIYCKPFSSSDIQERQKSLQKYNFTCNCTSCQRNWPTLPDLPTQLNDLPSQLYKIPVNKINNQIKRIQRCEENLKKILKQKDYSVKSIIDILSSIVDQHYKLLYSPHGSLVYYENQLHQALLHLYSAKVGPKVLQATTISWPL
ncbi:SET and MYND domain-containing protein 4 [Eurytemora carolleeae]|uniref:SET and MYND domain-containing protein 4 n=1 Tax=Eurytemora carolleeae TaxID=1294199 RepID=UPI000C785334|nr:SET and MYND domain-containing protein 4 [Eurytemora carolleeae]|eukprot:XP_023339922.1 SET and MYND domain-containing protein 4-like [Eurytemora affinis]